MQKDGWHCSRVSCQHDLALRLTVTSFSTRAAHVLCERCSLVNSPTNNSKSPPIYIYPISIQILFYSPTCRFSPADRSHSFTPRPGANPTYRPVVLTEAPIIHWPIKCTLTNPPRRRGFERCLPPPTPLDPNHLGQRSPVVRVSDAPSIYCY